MTIMRGYHGRLSGGGLGVISYILNASKYKCYFFFYIYACEIHGHLYIFTSVRN